MRLIGTWTQAATWHSEIMRYLIDTNVISELVRPEPSDHVLDWLGKQSGLDLAISALTPGELSQGTRSLAAGRRRDELDRWLEHDVTLPCSGRGLPTAGAPAIDWGRLSAAAKQGGRPLGAVDGLLLATASVYRLILVTRNVGDC